MTYNTATYATYSGAATVKGLALRPSDGAFYTIVSGKNGIINFSSGTATGTGAMIALASGGTHIYGAQTGKIQRDASNWLTTTVTSCIGADATYGKYLLHTLLTSISVL